VTKNLDFFNTKKQWCAIFQNKKMALTKQTNFPPKKETPKNHMINISLVVIHSHIYRYIMQRSPTVYSIILVNECGHSPHSHLTNLTTPKLT